MLTLRVSSQLQDRDKLYNRNKSINRKQLNVFTPLQCRYYRGYFYSRNKRSQLINSQNAINRDQFVDVPAIERRRYIVTSSLIGWAHTQNDPCIKCNIAGYEIQSVDMIVFPLIWSHAINSKWNIVYTAALGILNKC